MKINKLSHSKIKSVFVSYDGDGQSYLETLFLPLLGSIRKNLAEFSVLQFNPYDHPQRETDSKEAKTWGVELYFLNYHNKPRALGTAIDIMIGVFKLNQHVRKKRIDVIHARTHIPGIMALLVRFRHPHLKIIFDTDGFVPEERIDFGLLSKNSFSYKLLKFAEKHLINSADSILTRTVNAQKILVKWYGDKISDKIVAISNGKNENLYQPISRERRNQIRKALGINQEAILVIYVGSIGTHYLPEKMFRLFATLKYKYRNAYFLILTGANKKTLNDIAQKEGLSKNDYKAMQVMPEEIPNLISSADIGISFRQPSLSMLGVSPIKVCEYLLCGIPVIANTGVGDIDELFNNNEIGFMLNNFDDIELDKAVNWIIENINFSDNLKEKCRKIGLDNFALSVIAEKYNKVYEDLILSSQSK